MPLGIYPRTLQHNRNLSKALKGIKKPSLLGNQHARGHKPNITTFKKGITPWNKGKPYQKIRGKNHWAWKGGNTQKRPELHRIEYKIWRKTVFERDDFTCRICKKRGGYKEAHHINNWDKFPELRYNIVNGITLCRKCHISIHRGEVCLRLTEGEKPSVGAEK